MSQAAHHFDLEAPIIITGRGGSGTRMLSTLLQSVDLFLGNRINQQGDSMEWVKLNRKMLQQNISLENGQFTEKWQHLMEQNAHSILATEQASNHQAWGAKLPEFMFFIPELKQVFPKAKFIHLIRHPIHLSLRRSHVSSRLGNAVGDIVLPKAYEYAGLPFDPNNQQEHINNAVSWYYQLSKVTDHFAQHVNQSDLLTIKYEDILVNHQVVLDSLCRFLALPKTKESKLVVDLTRANQDIKSHQQAKEVWQICGQLANRFGYEYTQA